LSSNGVCPLVRAYRNGVVESEHCGAIVISDAHGKIIASLGDPDLSYYVRSSGKPFQAIAVVENGAAEHYDYTDQELAVTCASHSGERVHINLVQGILDKIGLGPEHLQCGPALPGYEPFRNELIRAGEEKKRIYNNCSGKHSGMLASCAHMGYPVENYYETDHPHQQHIIRIFSELCDYPADAIKLGNDGCGVPVHSLPLRNVAMGMARFLDPVGQPAERGKAMEWIGRAMAANPRLTAGTGRNDTEMVGGMNGKIFAKSGAVAYYVMAIRPEASKYGPLGVALKISDGNAVRGVAPTVMEILAQLGVLSPEEAENLSKWHHPMVKNTRDEIVGEVIPEFKLEWN
jgi:L-asparaginase II